MAHATAIQEKHKFDAFVNHFKMQSARAVARVWLSGSSDILAAARDRSSYASELEPCGERLSRKWPTVCSSGALACKSGPHGRGTGVTDARTTAATSAIPLHDAAYPGPASLAGIVGAWSTPIAAVTRWSRQFTFVAPCKPTANRTGTPSNVPRGQFTFAVSQGNAGRTTTGTPVPGGQMRIANALRSLQQVQQIQRQQAMQQPMQTSQMQSQQLQTPQTQTQHHRCRTNGFERHKRNLNHYGCLSCRLSSSRSSRPLNRDFNPRRNRTCTLRSTLRCRDNRKSNSNLNRCRCKRSSLNKPRRLR
ncbi:hypothetical protein BKA70DRAFT_1330279 [Coprinopsis sp. MPI-PUGE-AT-0042]|nr:hypothetical protein BKA70DRAFT_1330279 [Coprinopsis sp. MPI-PUGE-AT-0042]